jgi:hypothetical protein
MTLKVVGAGLGRTGTHSLKAGLEQLLGAPCYHMLEVFGRPDDIPVWHAAVNGDEPDWNAFLSDYRAAVDWPAAAFWREIWAANPDAVVLLSSCEDADAWWTSANNTIFQLTTRPIPPEEQIAAAQISMATAMLSKRFTPDWQDETAAKRAYEQHNAAVRASVPPEQLIDYHAGDGWAPICEKLGITVPSEPFPHLNTTDEFRAMVGMDPLV